MEEKIMADTKHGYKMGQEQYDFWTNVTPPDTLYSRRKCAPADQKTGAPYYRPDVHQGHQNI